MTDQEILNAGFEVAVPCHRFEHRHETMKEFLDEQAPGKWLFCEEWREGPNVISHSTFYIADEAAFLLFGMEFNVKANGEHIWPRDRKV